MWVSVRQLLRDIQAKIDSLETRESPGLDPVFIDRLNALEGQVEALVIAVDEGIQRVDRSERRVNATVKRARKKLAEEGVEDPTLDAEAVVLESGNAERSAGGGVQPMRPHVVPDADQASSIPGVSLRALRKVRGF